MHKFIFRSNGQHPNHPTTATYRRRRISNASASFLLLFRSPFHRPLISIHQENPIWFRMVGGGGQYAGKISSLGRLLHPIKRAPSTKGKQSSEFICCSPPSVNDWSATFNPQPEVSHYSPYTSRHRKSWGEKFPQVRKDQSNLKWIWICPDSQTTAVIPSRSTFTLLQSI